MVQIRKTNCTMQTHKTWLMTLQVEYLNTNLKVSAQEEYENALRLNAT